VSVQNLDGQLNMCGDRVNLSASVRFEALVNNLVFRVPETFIKPTHLGVTVTKYVRTLLSPSMRCNALCAQRH
jgi:hypothetical protein